MPVVDTKYQGLAVEKEGNGERQVVPGGIGLLPDDVYDRQLHPWVAAIRRRVVANLAWESDVLAAMQVSEVQIQPPPERMVMFRFR